MKSSKETTILLVLCEESCVDEGGGDFKGVEVAPDALWWFPGIFCAF